MNNKGTTLVELLISLVLMSIVLVFLFALLSDLKNEDYLSNSRVEDTSSRTEILHLIQNDLLSNKLNNIKIIRAVSSSYTKIEVSFEYQSMTKKLEVYNTKTGQDYVIYDREKWILSSGKYEFGKILYCDYSTSNYHLFKLSIPSTHDSSSHRKLSIDVTYLGNSFTVSNSMALASTC